MCKDISTITAADADSISDYTFIQKEIDESFEQVLSRYMKELDIDISMLLKMTGISAGSIHYYKKGKRKISINHISAICIAMRLYPLRSKYLFSLARYQLDFHSKRDLRRHRTKIVRQMRRQIFCQIVQKSCRQAVACQRIFVQDDGKHASR